MSEELNIIEKINKLNNEDLEFYKKLISFFDFIGISKDDLKTLVKLVKTFPEFIDKINSVLNDQKIINERYTKIIKSKEEKGQPFDNLNKDIERLNIYGK